MRGEERLVRCRPKAVVNALHLVTLFSQVLRGKLPREPKICPESRLSLVSHESRRLTQTGHTDLRDLYIELMTSAQ